MMHNVGWIESSQHAGVFKKFPPFQQELEKSELQDFNSISRDVNEKRNNPNIVDHYYYPDSDLETIAEESSVLDSEDDVSGHFRINGVGSATAWPQINSGSDDTTRDSDGDDSYSSLSSSSTPRKRTTKSSSSPPVYKQAAVINLTNKDSNKHSKLSAYINGQSRGSTNDPKDGKPHGSVDPFAQQKIVYAKCLTPKRNQTAAQVQPAKYEEISIEPTSEDNKSSDTITDMFKAALDGNLSALNAFSASELSNTVDENGNTALHIAAERGHLACVKKVVSISPPQMVTLPNDDLMTPTAMAVKGGSFECVQWLISRTAARSELTISQRPSSIDGSSTRPPVAHVAARFNRPEMLDWICEEMSKENIAIDTADHCSNTPVHVAARNGHLSCIQALVSRGASVTLINSDGDTPGQAAKKHDYNTCVGYLVVVETCVSLAQQIVALRNDMDSLQLENENLRNDLVAQRASRVKNGVAGNCTSTEKKEADNATVTTNGYHQQENYNNTSVDGAQQTNLQNRRVLQEQPPPPKLWSSPKQDISGIKTSEKDSKSSSALLHPKERNAFNPETEESMQERINAALNGPGTPIDCESQNLHGEKTLASDQAKSQLPGRGGTNNEVEAITKDIQEPVQKKPWEKLTMDEMLRMVRDIRYQPSPSISLCTEDSTMESMEVMRERMAAASRWFLVENTKDKTQSKPVLPIMRNGPRTDVGLQGGTKRLISKNWNHGRQAGGRSTASIPLKVQHHRQDKKNIHTAIQQQYNQSNKRENCSVENLLAKTATNKNTESGSVSDRIAAGRNQQIDAAQTGTLKFMVSHAKPPVYVDSKKKIRDQTPLKQSPTSSTSYTPQDTPSSTPTMSTQRSNSYRKAVELPHSKSSSEVKSSSDSLSSENTSSSDSRSVILNDRPMNVNEKLNLSPKRVWAQNLSKDDPLHKRTGSDIRKSSHTRIQNSSFSSTPVLKNIPNKNKTPNSSNSYTKIHSPTSTSSPNSPHYLYIWSLPRRNPGNIESNRSNAYPSKYNTYDPGVSEVPEIKTEIPTRQSSFLRKVQGKLK